MGCGWVVQLGSTSEREVLEPGPRNGCTFVLHACAGPYWRGMGEKLVRVRVVDEPGQEGLRVPAPAPNNSRHRMLA
jgi:hypothetical protein